MYAALSAWRASSRPAAHDVLNSLAWSGGLLVVFALLAARSYARMGR
jgi:hypothetical protein